MLELLRLNIIIKYIEGVRNIVADGLLRIIFTEKCELTPIVTELQEEVRKHTDKPVQIQKDSKEGYGETLKRILAAYGEEGTRAFIEATVNITDITALVSRILSELQDQEGQYAFSPLVTRLVYIAETNFVGLEIEDSELVPSNNNDEGDQPSVYTKEKAEETYDSQYRELIERQYSNIVRFYRHNKLLADITGKIKVRAFKRKVSGYRYYTPTGTLYKRTGSVKTGKFVRCLAPREVTLLLRKVHDEAGHFNRRIVYARLIQQVQQLDIIRDIYAYIYSYIRCKLQLSVRKHSKPFRLSIIIYPQEIIEADLIQFPTRNEFRYLLVVVDIFSRFVLVEPLKDTNAETIRAALRRIFQANIYPLILSYNPGTEFAIVSRQFKSKGIRTV